MEWQPSNTTAEESLIGALIGKHGDNSKIFDQLKPADFYNKDMAGIYSAALELHKVGTKADYTTVSAGLNDADFTRLGMLIKNTPSASNIYSYAKMVRDKSTEREALTKLSEAIEIIKGAGNTPDKASEALSLINTISTNDNGAGPEHVKEIAKRWLNTYDDRINNPDSAGYKTGVVGLDELLGARGIGRTDMIVIGARPKLGKTQLAVKIADYMARQESLPTLIFSMEMPKEQIFERFLTNGSKVSGNNFYQEMENYDYARISEYISDVMDKKLYIDDRPNLSLNQIKSTCRRFKEEHGELGPIFVDYFTLMKTKEAGRTDLAFGANSTGLKDLAKELGSPVILLAQLSRGVDSRPNKRPLISDLRESGSIEQDADLILFLYRESVYVPDSPLGGLTEVIAAANRHGGAGTAFLEMKGGWFEDVSDNEVNRAFSDDEWKD